MGLAQEVHQDKPAQWTIRLKSGIEFHNGKTLSADDVIYSLKRILDKANGIDGRAFLITIDPKRIKKLDKNTVRLFLTQPDSTILDALGLYTNTVVPAGYDPKRSHVGTGPFVFKSFSPGQRSVHDKNKNYWRSGQPFADQLVLIDFPDDTARVNALLGGQVDAIDSVPYGQTRVIEQNKNVKLLNNKSGQWLPFTMRIDQAPFTDVRVRQAFRLIVDRDQMIKQAISGFGFAGNDLYAPFDLDYLKAPQRKQDLDKAKSLLKAAGQDGLKIDLNTTAASAGMVEAAQVFAQQARGAGVTVNVKKLDSGTFYGADTYLKWVFAMDFWGTRNYLAQVADGSIPAAPFNECHWGFDAKWQSLYKQAKAAVDTAKRREIIQAMQKIEYDSGGYIIWAFNNLVDAYSAKVTGFGQAKTTNPLNGYQFRKVSFV
jgi:peptide/nickel transport system substrate-binding protein